MAPLSSRKAPSPPSSSSSSEDSSSADDEEQTTQVPVASQTPIVQPQPNAKEEEDDDDDDDEESSEEEEDEEEEEEEEEEEVQPKAKEPSKPPSESESESGSDEDSGSESESDAGEAAAQVLATPVTPTSPNTVEAKISGDNTESKKSQDSYFKRLYSLEDDIIILKAMADYQAKNGQIHVITSIIPHLHAFLGKPLSVNVNDMKLCEKIRRLKRKYEKQRKKGARKFSTDHDMDVYELSKKVWGEFAGESSKKRKKPISKEEVAKKRAKLEKSSTTEGKYPYLCEVAKKMNKLVGVGAVDGLDSGEAKSLEKKLKDVKMIEVNYRAKMMGLRMECFEFVAGCMKRSED